MRQSDVQERHEQETDVIECQGCQALREVIDFAGACGPENRYVHFLNCFFQSIRFYLYFCFHPVNGANFSRVNPNKEVGQMKSLA